MQNYELQYSFMSVGEENIQKLHELNQRLKSLEGLPLARAYGAFDRVASQVRSTDIIDEVGIVRTTWTGEKYGFFLMVTHTTNMKHTALWTEICKMDYPEIGVAVLGKGTEGATVCDTLYLPDILKLDNGELPPFPETFVPVKGELNP